jgi:hypothetical protein
MIYCKIVREFWRVYVYGCLLFKQLPEPSFCHGCSDADSYPPKISYILTLLYNQRLTSKKTLTNNITITFFLTTLVEPRFCCRNPCELIGTCPVVAVLTERYGCVTALYTLTHATLLQFRHGNTEHCFSYNMDFAHKTPKEKRGAMRPLLARCTCLVSNSVSRGDQVDNLNQ